MDWSRAKSIFIITFLLLNLFLGYQLNEKRNANKISLLAEATLQERLSEMNIIISADLHEEQLTGTYISGLTDVSLKSVIEGKNFAQQVNMIDDEVIEVQLNRPYSLDSGNRNIRVDSKEFLLHYVSFGDEYRYSHYDDQLNQIFFYQTYEGKMVDNYESGRFPLVLHLDEHYRITAYEQHYLTLHPIHPQGKEQEIITGIKAIEKLFNEHLIPPDSEINKVELSYFSFFSKPLGEVQVFAPMWNIGVNGQVFYVNAIDGAVQNIQ
jgi:regulatory protein YycI of two-component signal transduction system YycFG